MLTKEQEIELLMMTLADDPHSDICHRILELNEQIKTSKSQEIKHNQPLDQRHTEKRR